MPSDANETMERASRALAKMEYLTCEALCLDALAAARRQEDWSLYARVLLPLQEARRQRRMIACDAGVRLEPGDERDPAAGCVVLRHPHTPEQARELRKRGRQQQKYLEVLYVAAEDEGPDPRWVVCSDEGPAVSCPVPPPAAPPDEGGQRRPDVSWYLMATEALGDAAIAAVDAPLGSIARLEALERSLAVVVDHEKLHQRLGDAARALRQQSGGGGSG